MEARELRKKTKIKKPTLARAKDLEEILAMRRAGLRELYEGQLKESELEVLLTTTTQPKSLEKCIDKNTVYLIRDPNTKELQGYFQMKYQVIAGDNGLCELLSFLVYPHILTEEYFPQELSAIEYQVQQAGCYRIKGVASQKEYDILEPFDYKLRAPKYRHILGTLSLNFVPFSKTLYHPKI